MKQLLIWRHAKSDWHSGTIDDFDRPLNERGFNAAEMMALHLAHHFSDIDLVLCSAAKRTQMTLAPLREHLTAADIHILDQLYLASSDKMLALIHQKAMRADEKLLIVGHNPGCQELVLNLSKEKTGPHYDAARLKFVTGSCAIFDCQIDTWDALNWDTATLTNYIQPKNLS